MDARTESGPDFLCIGAQKAGTGWLYDQLQHHADFWMPPIKELHYFDARPSGRRKAEVLFRSVSEDLVATNREREQSHHRPLDQRDIDFLAAFSRLTQGRPGFKSYATRLMAGGSKFVGYVLPGYARLHRQVIHPFIKTTWGIDYEAYASLFSVKGTALAGDITPGYSTLHPRVIERITKRFPGLKVVFIARDPVERLWSMLVMRVRKGRHQWPIDQVMVTRLLQTGNIANRTFQTRTVARWRRFVPDSQFGLFVFDDLVRDAAEFRGHVLTFLGGDPRMPSGRLATGFNRKEGAKAPLPDELRELFGQLLADELKASAAEFGGAATSWPGKYGC